MNSTHGACPATTLSSFIQAALDEKRITPEVLTRELKALYRTIQRPLKKIPPPSSAPGHTRREEAVDRRLTSIASAITNLARRIGMERQAVRAFMRTLKPYLRTIIVTIGDINEKNPYFFPAIAHTILVLLIPLSSILNWLGWGYLGPKAGTAASFMQSVFFGPAVSAGSWFAQLQAAGMGGSIPFWFWLAIKGPLVFGGILAMVLPWFKDAPQD